MYRPDVSRDENDDGEGTKPGITHRKQHIARNLWASEVPQSEKDHANA